MAISNPHLHWFNLKCPYPQNSTAYKAAKARLHNATYADLERLRAEFDMYQRRFNSRHSLQYLR
jgi:hypothetical protein